MYAFNIVQSFSDTNNAIINFYDQFFFPSHLFNNLYIYCFH